MEVRPLNARERQILKLKNGVKVSSVLRGSTIDRTNLKPNFIITEVNGRSVSTETDLVAALQKAGKEVKLKGVYENVDEPYFYVFHAK
jgi:serine protease Do